MPDVDVRELIVESATKFFSRYGFHKTTMDEIAKNIHKAKGVLYYYFRSKEELFNEVLRQELLPVKTELAGITSSSRDYLTITREYFLVRLGMLSKAVNYHETLKADFFEKYHFVKDVRDDFDNFERTQLSNIFTRGHAEGFVEAKQLNSIVNIVMMILKGIELPLYVQGKYEEFEGTIGELVTMITNSLRFYRK